MPAIVIIVGMIENKNENLVEKYRNEAEEHNYGNGVPYMYAYTVNLLNRKACEALGREIYHETKYGYTRQPVDKRIKQWHDDYYHDDWALHAYRSHIRPCFDYDVKRARMVFFFDETYHKVLDDNGLVRLKNQVKPKNVGNAYISQEMYDVSDDAAFAFIGKKRPADNVLKSWNDDEWERHSCEIMDEAERRIHEIYERNADNASILKDNIIKFMPYGSDAALAFEKHYVPIRDFIARVYQDKAVLKAFEILTGNYLAGKPPVKVVLWAPTRSGKSFMMAMLFAMLRHWWEDKRNFSGIASRNNHNQANFAVTTAIPAVFIELREALEANKNIAYSDGMTTYRHHMDETGKMDENCHTYRNSPDKMTCMCPCTFDCITSKDLKTAVLNGGNAINDCYARNAKATVLQVSVQDYMGSTEEDEDGNRLKAKEQHVQLNDNEFLLKAMDEVQLGGSEEAVRFNAAWNYANNNDDATVFNGIHPVLGELLVSATPYPVLHSASTENVVVIIPREIREDAEKWLVDNVDNGSMKPWQSPYFGIPERIITGMDVSNAINGIDSVDDMTAVQVYQRDSNRHRKGEIRLSNDRSQPMLTSTADKALTAFTGRLFGVDGIDGNFVSDNVMALLSGEDIHKVGVRRPGFTVLISVNRRSSAVAVANRMRELLGKDSIYEKQHGLHYDVRCMYSYDNNGNIVNNTVEGMKEIIRKNDASNQPTIIVTVDMMMTGSTVPEVTTLIMMRSGKSVIVREQAYGRIGSPYTMRMPLHDTMPVIDGKPLTDDDPMIEVDDNGDKWLHANMKPSALVIDLDPSEMYASLYNQQVALKSIRERNNENNADIDDPYQHVILCEDAKMTELKPDDIREKYMLTHRFTSISEAAAGIAFNDFNEPDDPVYAELVKNGKNLRATGDGIIANIASNETCSYDGCENKVVPGTSYCLGHLSKLSHQFHDACADDNDSANPEPVSKANNKKKEDGEPDDNTVLDSKQAARLFLEKALNAVIVYNVITGSDAGTIDETIRNIRTSEADRNDRFHNVRIDWLGIDADMLEKVNAFAGILFDSGALSCALDSLYARRRMLMKKHEGDALPNARVISELLGSDLSKLSSNEILTSIIASDKIAGMFTDEDIADIVDNGIRTFNLAAKNSAEVVAIADRMIACIEDNDGIIDKDAKKAEVLRNMYSMPTSPYTLAIMNAVYDSCDELNADNVVSLPALSTGGLAGFIRALNGLDAGSVETIMHLLAANALSEDDFTMLISEISS